MINLALYKKEIKGSIRLLVIFGAIMTMYVAIIISMYEPEMMELLDSYARAMPEIMAAVGMTAGAADLLGFMISYLYGFILLIFPMVYAILRGNGLVARYVDRGSMVYLAAAPMSRGKIARTQAFALVTGQVLLMLYITGLELGTAHYFFPGELEITELLMVNGGLLCLHLFIGGICFLFSCLFSDAKYSLAFGAGISTLMYVVQMVANVGEETEKAKYFTFFTLFDPSGIAAGQEMALTAAGILLGGALLLYGTAIAVFCRKDLHI